MSLSTYQQMLLKNQWQGDQRRALCVCSVGMLRSPTLAFILNKSYNMNARSCGTDPDALIPISEKLVYWADVVFVIGADNLPEVNKLLEEFNMTRRLHLLDIEDVYGYMDTFLVSELKSALKPILGLGQ